MYKRILVPLDGSLMAECILPTVGRLATRLQASVELVSVVTLEKVDRIAAIECLDRAKAALPHGMATTKILEGPATETIIAEAESHPDTLIAMSTHGRSGIGRWAMGSVADKVVRHGNLPVLVIRPGDQAPSTDKESTSSI